MTSRRLWRRLTPLVAAGALVLAVTACGDDSSSETVSETGEVTGTLRLGYFPNLTHAPAIYGLEEGIFADKLGDGVKIETSTFNSGVQASEALASGALDATYIGPNPAINLFTKSNGEAIRIVSGATSGGAGLVVRPEITTVDQLRGKVIATPSLGNTQDVAARHYFTEHGLTVNTEGGGDLQILPQDNALAVDSYNSGAIDGAWVPEPTLSRLVAAGAHVLVDEADEWPNGQFVTTHLIVSTEYLKANPEIVRRLVEANVASVEALNADQAAGQAATNAAIGELTGKPLDADLLAAAWKNLTFTPDPIASSLFTSAENALDLGLVDTADLDGIYDLTLLNEILVAEGKPEVSAE